MAKELKVEEQINSLDEEALLDVMTLEFVERRIVRRLRDHLLGKEGFSFDDILEVIRHGAMVIGPVRFSLSEKKDTSIMLSNAVETAGEILAFRNHHFWLTFRRR